MWLTAHAELRTSARIRRVYDGLSEAFTVPPETPPSSLLTRRFPSGAVDYFASALATGDACPPSRRAIEK